MERKRINIFILFLILIVFLGAMGFLFAEKPLTNSIKDLTQRTEETRFTKIHHHKQYMSTFRELPSLHIQQHPPSENVKQLQETIDKALDHDNLEGAIKIGRASCRERRKDKVRGGAYKKKKKK